MAKTLWIVPMGYVVASVTLAILLTRWDRYEPWTWTLDLSASAASTALAALGGGMITFTGFVTSIVLLVIQFGSSQFSPRFLNWFRNNPILKHALGTFIATFLFALVATVLTGRGDSDVVPYRALFGALALSLASVGWFLALLSRTSNGLRVAYVTQQLDVQARQVFEAVYPTSYIEVEAAVEALTTLADEKPVQEVRRHSVGMILVAVDRRALLRHAVRHGAVIELAVAVGDHVATDSVVLRVRGDEAISERRLNACLIFGDERTIEDDPAFCVRLLVDVAIKALSPTVNDPTTAVQCLHRIEDVLRYAASKQLSEGVVTDAHHQARVIIPTPSWDDLVSLSFDEIRMFGAGQYQIARRMRALLLDLLADLPEKRRPALTAHLELLDDAVRAKIPAGQLANALVPDRQGLGLGRGKRDG